MFIGLTVVVVVSYSNATDPVSEMRFQSIFHLFVTQFLSVHLFQPSGYFAFRVFFKSWPRDSVCSFFLS
ncbi:Protein CBG25902 [Caenorhabditis briggsae]|uniref:Protein CBG25902 n=1 Tax=Caenorhabditis briggsae TaxID=6238 RepID=B6IHL2_CAEBR|nr:Protein CBG25902 [Caenorhabditis briggsae]CAR99413.1 Protein CBG25902 [Caenorhabditis briggsae]